ncbi:MAG: tRNA uridine-5-carboxymethylaminomethyl(34) synthesis GTPase MnmE [Victivallales bacterium]|nr:tRNA uridine-5-carboxymethylaminomethyl(34) synthesis GTPase MnmE [Victivallales bacterium]
MNDNDTVAAICSGVGSAITIVRISGKQALDIGNRVWKSTGNILSYSTKRQMLLGRFYSENDNVGETAMAVFMPGPKSYTGEDVVELHAHGGSFNAKRIIEEVILAGARPAKEGEFTYRAFMNGKMDLTQAEAVSDLITANSTMAMHLAEKQMNGALGRKISNIRNILINILAECESRLDFPEEELDFTPVKQQKKDLTNILHELEYLYRTRIEGNILREGISAVIAGRPNSGKSSLLNILLGYDRAITTDIPGTTRDTLEEIANIRGIPVKLIDTAGVRLSSDPIEEIGINRTLSSLKRSQVTIWLLDASAANLNEEVVELENRLKNKTNTIVAWNKIDLLEKEKERTNTSTVLPKVNFPNVKISVKEEIGINELLDIFEKTVWNHPHLNEPEVAVSARHAEYLNEAISVIPGALATLQEMDWELASSNIKTAVNALGCIIGEDASVDIYETIFSKFCIGK